MTIQLIHCSDLHLDSAFPTMLMDDMTVQNRRRDLLDNFTRVVDYAHKNKPDVFIISGDIFDTTNPSNETLILFTRKIRELHDKGIKVFLIGGNHDLPKSTNNVIMSIDILKNAGIATVLGSSRVLHKKKLSISGKSLCIYGKSYFSTHADEKKPLLVEFRGPLEGDYNMLLLHTTLIAIPELSPAVTKASINNDILHATKLPSKLNYVALGQNHNHFQVNHNGCKICNAGSIEKMEWSEIDQAKGFIWVELNDSETKAEFIELPTRKMKLRQLDISSIVSTGTRNITDYMATILSDSRDKQAIFKLDIKGSISSQNTSLLKLSELHEKYRKRFFHLQLDMKDMQVVHSSEGEKFGILDGLAEVSPINTFIRRVESLAAEPTRSEGEKQFLFELKKRGIKYLRSINTK